MACAIAAACAAAECGRRGLAVKPRKGAALLFWSLQPDGKTKDMHSLHGGCPVIKVGAPTTHPPHTPSPSVGLTTTTTTAPPRSQGDKWSATKWIRVHEHQVWN